MSGVWSGGHGAVAVVLSESGYATFDDPYFSAILRAASRELGRVGRHMVTMFVDAAASAEAANSARVLASGRLDGALVFTSRPVDPLYQVLESVPLPIVFGGKPAIAGRGMYTVDFDHNSGARLAVRHLVGIGRRTIATITGPADHPAAAARLEGWFGALAERGLDTEGLAEEGGFTLEGGERAMRELLRRRPDIDAVFAADDHMAAGAVRALFTAGRWVPRDVAIVGFNNHPALAPALDPPLTSVHQDPWHQVAEMVAVLGRLLAGERVRTRHRMLPVSLAQRASA